jgi:hypothetical protein
VPSSPGGWCGKGGIDVEQSLPYLLAVGKVSNIGMKFKIGLH